MVCYIAASEDKQAPITAEEREAIKRQIEDEYRQKIYSSVSLYEPLHEKTGFSHMLKQRRRSAAWFTSQLISAFVSAT